MNNKKKVMIILGIIIVLVAVAVSLLLYSRYDNRTREVGDELGLTREKITGAYIRNGNNGESTELKQNEIDSIYNALINVSIKPRKAERRAGWGYEVVFERGDELSGVLVEGPMTYKINERTYDVGEKEGCKVFEEIQKIVKK